MTLPSTSLIRDIVDRALGEDLPDITSDAIFAPDERGRAYFLVKEDGIIAGLAFAGAVFDMLDEHAHFRALVADGSVVRKGDRVAEVEATVRALLSGERTALNLVQRASGIATATRKYVDAVAGTRAVILDTRKTVPGLRALDKYAVAAGGGTNHRHGLHDMFLVKNNHIDRAGSIAAAVARIRETRRPQKLMIEVRDLDELEQALALAPDYILLDNMDNATMSEAVRRAGGRVPLEASGGVTLASVREIAATGVDRISVGALTHTVDALDISMRVE
jgi:nicotinate-nucleotide pyrophosphorylase (carboxylating)